MPFQFLNERFALNHLLVDLPSMIMIIGERGMDRGETELRMAGDDLINRKIHPLVPDHHILHSNPRSGNPRLASANPRRELDMDRDGSVFNSGWGRGLHASILQSTGPRLATRTIFKILSKTAIFIARFRLRFSIDYRGGPRRYTDVLTAPCATAIRKLNTEN